MHKKRLYPGLALLLIVFIFGSLFTVDLLKSGKSAHAVTPDDWTTYLYNLGHSGFNSAETAINPNTAGGLKQLWSISEGSIISTQPTVANGLIYWGSWDGIEHATKLDGSQAWTANLGTAGTVSGGADVIGVPTLSRDWLFAEGYTGGHFQQYFVLANLDPAKTAATVTITLEYNDGIAHAFPVSVNPLSQLVWNVNTAGTGATSQSVSAEISAKGAKIVAERELYFGYNHMGDGRTTRATGGTDVLGQVGPAAVSAYSFAEGYTNLGYDEWLTIQNPTPTSETITVTVANAMGTLYTFSVQVLGHSRYTVDMVAVVMQHLYHPTDGYNGYEISLAVHSSNGPCVVERPMYWNASGTLGGSDVIGYAGG
jgi:hypothetical protein